MRPGGCLALYAEHLEVDGSIGVDAEFNGIGGGNCAGSSGGDLRIISNRTVISGTLHANGSSGSHFNIDAGGGAGGSILVHSSHTTITGSGVIVTQGGAPSYDRNTNPHGGPGGGAGGRGGAGGGAGSGGPGSFDDPPTIAAGSSDRPLAIIGQLDIEQGGVIHSLDGASNINGNISLAGQASLSRPHVFGSQFTLYPFSIRLMGLDGEGLADVRLSLTQAEGMTHELGVSDLDGWILGSLNEDLIFRTDLPHTIEFEGVISPVRQLWLSYGDIETEQSCALELSFDTPTVTLPPLGACPLP